LPGDEKKEKVLIITNQGGALRRLDILSYFIVPENCSLV